MGERMLTGRFPTLRRVLTKMIEVAGAGCASAIAAFLLGNSHEAERPPMPVPPAVVQLAPADEQMIRYGAGNRNVSRPRSTKACKGGFEYARAARAKEHAQQQHRGGRGETASH